MENLLKNSDLSQKSCHDSMMSMEVIDLPETDAIIDTEDELRKSNLRDYLEIFGYMDDTL